jgi:DNA-binding MarR family transcriptional regulator
MAKKPAYGKVYTALTFKHSREFNTIYEFRVLAALITHYNHNTKRCDPSIETLANELGICEKTVRNTIKLLKDKGFITVIRGHHNSYILGWKCWSLVPGFSKN